MSPGPGNKDLRKILVIQTAFIGDVILTIPLIQLLKRNYESSSIDVVVVPRAADLFHNHPSVNRILPYDKRGKDRGIRGFRRMLAAIRSNGYDAALIPHRSLRSALLPKLAGIPERIGFDTSSGRWLLTDEVPYNPSLHEIERNISLLGALGLAIPAHELPCLYPADEDRMAVDKLFMDLKVTKSATLIGVAPGTIWNTKRWLTERFSEVVQKLGSEGYEVVLVGGPEDTSLCGEIKVRAGSSKVHNLAGALSLLQSAEVLRRCRVLVSNDSAPMHLGVAVHTPVVAIFGATVPEFGFAPYGERDIILETKGLSCRPCSIHGGERCPIGTFDCMMRITSEQVLSSVKSLVEVGQE